jgi:hypothetical protein
MQASDSAPTAAVATTQTGASGALRHRVGCNPACIAAHPAPLPLPPSLAFASPPAGRRCRGMRSRGGDACTPPPRCGTGAPLRTHPAAPSAPPGTLRSSSGRWGRSSRDACSPSPPPPCPPTVCTAPVCSASSQPQMKWSCVPATSARTNPARSCRAGGGGGCVYARDGSPSPLPPPTPLRREVRGTVVAQSVGAIHRVGAGDSRAVRLNAVHRTNAPACRLGGRTVSRCGNETPRG